MSGDTPFARCARLVEQADGLLVTAGAGLGVDSGLPDFRGSAGMWLAYPALGRACLAFEEIACPDAFVAQPRLAWGFYGHRLQLYRDTVPGPAFGILRRIAARLAHGAFVFTSNVDGQFQQAGFDAEHIVECHGSIHHLQCMAPCAEDIWPADAFRPQVDADACQLRNDPPRCPRCGGLARPNVLMFGDWGWLDSRTAAQQARFDAWRRRVARPLVIELGAGTAIPSVRVFGQRQRAPLIRVNPREPGVGGARDVALAMGATEAMRGIAAVLGMDAGG